MMLDSRAAKLKYGAYFVLDKIENWLEGKY